MIGTRLNELRKSKNMSQNDLSKVLSLTRFTISSYENDRSEPSLKTLTRICKLYDISADYLLGLIDNQIPIERKSDFLVIFYSLPTGIQEEIKNYIEFKAKIYKNQVKHT